MKVCIKGKYVEELRAVPDSRRYFSIVEDASEADVLILDHKWMFPKAAVPIIVRIGWDDLLHFEEDYKSTAYRMCRMLINPAIVSKSHCYGFINAEVLVANHLHMGVEATTFDSYTDVLPLTTEGVGTEEHACPALPVLTCEQLQRLSPFLPMGWDLNDLATFRKDIYNPLVKPGKNVGKRLCNVLQANAEVVRYGLAIHPTLPRTLSYLECSLILGLSTCPCDLSEVDLYNRVPQGVLEWIVRQCYFSVTGAWQASHSLKYDRKYGSWNTVGSHLGSQVIFALGH